MAQSSGDMTKDFNAANDNSGAAKQAFVDSIQDILENGGAADFKAVLYEKYDLLKRPDNEGRGLLGQAVMTGRVEIVRGVLEYAEEQGPEFLRDMLEQRAEKAPWTTRDTTAIYDAVKENRPEIVELLLDYGAQANLSLGHRDMTPLHHAIDNECYDVARILIEKGNVDLNKRVDEHGHTVVKNAIYRDDNRFLDLLLRNGADPDIGDNGGITPLMTACACDNVEKVKLLLDAGVDYNAVSEEGVTAIWMAGEETAPLLMALPDIACDVPGQWGSTPLIRAAENGHMVKFDLLLAAGANPNAVGDKKRTPLHKAVIRGNADMVETLLLHGADLAAKDSEGFTPLLCAAHWGETEIFKRLLAAGADIGEVSARGGDILCHGAVGGDAELARWLIAEKKFKTDFRDNRKLTPLHFACNVGHYGYAKVLLEAGADPNAKDVEGLTPLHHLAHRAHYERDNPEEWLALAKLMVGHGADADARTPRGQNAYECSMRHGHDMVVDYLKSLTENKKDTRQFSGPPNCS